MNNAIIESPCINICVLDDDISPEACAGCYRTAEEITQWTDATNERKQEILNLAKQRRAANSRVTFK